MRLRPRSSGCWATCLGSRAPDSLGFALETQRERITSTPLGPGGKVIEMENGVSAAGHRPRLCLGGPESPAAHP